MKVIVPKSILNAPRIAFSGKSMLPLLKPGDELIVKYLSTDESRRKVEIGDVVLIKNSDGWTVHRVVSELRTKGDRSIFYDPDRSPFWAQVEGVRSNNKFFYWGDRGMLFKKQVAFLSEQTSTQCRWKRWPSLMLLSFLVKISLIGHRVHNLPPH